MALPAAVVLSGVPQEQFTGDLETVFNQGSVLLKSLETTPELTPEVTPEPTPESSRSPSPSESSSSFSSTGTGKSLDYYLGLIDKLVARFDRWKEYPNSYDYQPPGTRITYQNRNILDLASNLREDWTFQHAVLFKGVSSFFEHRSLFSRIDGAEMPPHKMICCTIDDCNFDDPVYL